MKKKAEFIDVNILKHEMLTTILELLKVKKPEPVDFGEIIEKMHEKHPSIDEQELMVILYSLMSDQYLITENDKFDGHIIVRQLRMKGVEAHIQEKFIQESKKEKRASRNETGQIISPYIALAALLITTVFFIVDKCSTPTSYEITIDEKVYHLKQK